MTVVYKTFISIGNSKQNFPRLLNTVVHYLHLLPQPIFIQRGHTSFENSQCLVIDFIDMDSFTATVANADLLIFHAGAGCVFHALKLGKLPILMPREKQFNEIVNDHQIAFAQALHQENKAIMIQKTLELPAAIADVKARKKFIPAIQKSYGYQTIEKLFNTLFVIKN